MRVDRRRVALDALTALLAIGGLTLVVVGGNPPQADPYRGVDAAAPQGPPAPSLARSAPGTDTPSAGTPGGGTAGNGTSGSATSNGATSNGATSDGDARAASTASGGARSPAGAPIPLGASVPVRLEIPAIGVSTALMSLGLNGDGTVAVPPLGPDAPAGWYRHLATPGEVGPAVLLGHVDSAQSGPAVFYRLRELRPGDTITVRREDGSTAVFAVDEVAGYPKAAFPSQRVYGTVDRPVLRLVTCGGTFDRIRRTYRENLVVYATLTASAPSPA